MGIAGAKMITVADDPPIFHDNRTDHRIRARRPPALCRKAKGQGHVVEIACADGHRFLRTTRNRRRVVRADAVDLFRDVDGLDDFLVSASAKAAWAAANLAIATR